LFSYAAAQDALSGTKTRGEVGSDGGE
jgi:hypothetical protein